MSVGAPAGHQERAQAPFTVCRSRENRDGVDRARSTPVPQPTRGRLGRADRTTPAIRGPDPTTRRLRRPQSGKLALCVRPACPGRSAGQVRRIRIPLQ